MLADQMNLVASSDPWGSVDDKGAEGAVLSVWNGANYVDTTVAGVAIPGTYGSLLLMSNGDYVYTPTTNLANVGQQETFTYQLKQADGDTDTAHLVIKISGSAYVAPTAINGTEGDDPTLAGTASDDVILAKAGGDIVHGLEGADHVEGGAGNDFLFGDAGDDFLLGGLDEDLLVGGLGNDSLVGGAGADTFAWQAAESGVDVVVDFIAGTDGLDLSQLLTGEHAQAGDIGNLLSFIDISSANLGGGLALDTVIKVSTTAALDPAASVEQTIVLQDVNLFTSYGAGGDEATVILGMLNDGSLKVDVA